MKGWKKILWKKVERGSRLCQFFCNTVEQTANSFF